MRKRWIELSVVALLASCDPGDGSTVDGATVTLSRVVCSSCTIESDSVAHLGGGGSRILLSMLPRTDSRGYFYASGMGNATQVMVFSADGKLAGGFGSPGTGSGAINRVSDIVVGIDDSVFVFDDGEVHVFSPQHKHVREVAVNLRGMMGPMGAPLVVQAGDLQRHARLADGSMVRAGSKNTFSVLSVDGVAGPAVTLPTDSTVKCVWCKYRSFIASGTDDRVYTAIEDDYVIEELDLSGALVRRFVRNASWFPKWRPRPEPPGDTDALADLSRPRLIGIRRTSDGLIWAHSYVMDKTNPLSMDLLGVFGDAANSGTVGGIPDDIAAQVQSHFTTRVEVFDPDRNELLASTSFPFLLVPMTGDMAARPTRRGRTHSEWTVFRVRLERTR